MNILIDVFLRRAWWQKVLLVQLIAIVGIQFAGTIGTKLLVPRFDWGESNDVFAGGAFDDTIEGRFARWDSSYYLRIAQQGYSDHGQDLVFFPLYPLLISLLYNTLGLSLLWSGWIVAVTCYVGAGLLLYQLIHIDHSAEIALWGVVWLSIFPVDYRHNEDAKKVTLAPSFGVCRLSGYIICMVCNRALGGLTGADALTYEDPEKLRRREVLMATSGDRRNSFVTSGLLKV